MPVSAYVIAKVYSTVQFAHNLPTDEYSEMQLSDLISNTLRSSIVFCCQQPHAGIRVTSSYHPIAGNPVTLVTVNSDDFL